MRTALNRDDYNTAQQISLKAITRYSDDEGVKNYTRQLARPLVASRPMSEEQRQHVLGSQDWVMAHRVEYQSRWVRLSNAELIFDAASLSNGKKAISLKQSQNLHTLGDFPGQTDGVSW